MKRRHAPTPKSSFTATWWGRVAVHAILPVVLCSCLVALFVSDLEHEPARDPAPAVTVSQHAALEEELADRYPRLGLLFHDQGDALLPEPTMTFGLVLLKHPDATRSGRFKRLTFDELGRSNNTCLLVDGGEQLFGHSPGVWRAMAEPLGHDRRGRERPGLRSIWQLPPQRITVTQHVEIVAGAQSRLLDTCLVRYTIHNDDSLIHNVGLRFLLDTFIGSNDGVPFQIPGVKHLVDQSRRFDSPAAVPEFIEALEHDRLDAPGTVAHLRLRLAGQIEPPTQVTLGAWPDPALAQKPGGEKARGQLTGWDVPVLSIHTLPQPDSAVTMYWDARALLPGQDRIVGFTYGLVGIASSEGKGELAVTMDGSFRPGGPFLVTAYLSRPLPGQTVSLGVPDGFTLLDGEATQSVPAVPADANRRQSAVVWRIEAPEQEGEYPLRVSSSAGVSQTVVVRIRNERLFD